MSMNIKTLRVTTYDIRVNVDNNMSGERGLHVDNKSSGSTPDV